MPYEERRFYCIDIFPLHPELKKLQQQLAQLKTAKAVLHTLCRIKRTVYLHLLVGDKILALMNNYGNA
jgi:hypothetical protein